VKGVVKEAGEAGKTKIGRIGSTKGGLLSCCLGPNENDKLPNE